MSITIKEMACVVTVTNEDTCEVMTVGHVAYNTYEVSITDGYESHSMRMTTEDFKIWRRLLEECTKGD